MLEFGARAIASCRNDEGATAVEYAIIIAFIATFIIGAVTALGIAVEPLYRAAASGMP